MIVINRAIYFLLICLFMGSTAYPQIQRKAEIVKGDDNSLRGYLSIALVYGEGFRPLPVYNNAMFKLAETMSTLTEIQTSVDQMVALSSGRLTDYPVVFLATTELITTTPQERANLRSYFERGGLLVIDNPYAYRSTSPVLNSARQMIRDTLGSTRFMPLPFDHSLNSSYFRFPDPPIGIELDAHRQHAEMTGPQSTKGRIDTWTGAHNKGVIEAVFFKNRLVAILVDKGYIVHWLENEELTPQLRYGVNIIMYAIKEGGIVRR